MLAFSVMYFNFIHANGIDTITSQCVCFFQRLFLTLLRKVIEYTIMYYFIYVCICKKCKDSFDNFTCWKLTWIHKIHWLQFNYIFFKGSAGHIRIKMYVYLSVYKFVFILSVYKLGKLKHGFCIYLVCVYIYR